jgi:hypothetical protein
VSPAWETPLLPGATLYYVAGERIEAHRLVGR